MTSSRAESLTGRLPGRFVLTAAFASVLLAIGACGSTKPTSPTPQAARSVPFTVFNDRSAEFPTREIDVFLKDAAADRQQMIERVAAKIAGMPEVELYTFMSKAQALEEFKKRLGSDADQILANLVGNPMPAAFKILVRTRNEVERVAERFFDDPAVDNSAPGKHDGVRFSGVP
jgi:hypothetical protein